MKISDMFIAAFICSFKSWQLFVFCVQMTSQGSPGKSIRNRIILILSNRGVPDILCPAGLPKISRYGSDRNFKNYTGYSGAFKNIKLKILQKHIAKHFNSHTFFQIMMQKKLIFCQNFLATGDFLFLHKCFHILKIGFPSIQTMVGRKKTSWTTFWGLEKCYFSTKCMGCTFHLHIVQPGIDLIPALTNFDFGYKKFGYPKFWPCKTLENLLDLLLECQRQ